MTKDHYRPSLNWAHISVQTSPRRHLLQTLTARPAPYSLSCELHRSLVTLPSFRYSGPRTVEIRKFPPLLKVAASQLPTAERLPTDNGCTCWAQKIPGQHVKQGSERETWRKNITCTHNCRIRQNWPSVFASSLCNINDLYRWPQWASVFHRLC